MEIDIEPLLETARLLYEGPWVSERYLATESLLSRKPEALLPVTDVLLAIPLNEFFDLCLRRAGFRLQSIGSVNLG